MPFQRMSFGECHFSTSLYALYPSKLACPDCSVGWESIPRKVIAYSNFAKSGAIVLSPFACGEIALENSVVHCIVAHLSTPPARCATLRQWPAGQLRLFLSILGIGKCVMLCNKRDEVAHCPLKRGEGCYCLFSYLFSSYILHHRKNDIVVLF